MITKDPQKRGIVDVSILEDTGRADDASEGHADAVLTWTVLAERGNQTRAPKGMSFATSEPLCELQDSESFTAERSI